MFTTSAFVLIMVFGGTSNGGNIPAATLTQVFSGAEACEKARLDMERQYRINSKNESYANQARSILIRGCYPFGN